MSRGAGWVVGGVCGLIVWVLSAVFIEEYRTIFGFILCLTTMVSMGVSIESKNKQFSLEQEKTAKKLTTIL